MNIGLFFGSFNPVHIGHLAIANYMAEYTNLEQIWFVVSPHNPLKQKSTLLADYHRLELLHRAIADDPRFKVSNVEFRMPQPSYTIDTLAVLTEKYPAHTFAIIMGSDGLATFDKWKNAGQIESRFQRYVYPRPGFPESIFVAHKNCTWVNAPQMDISSSFVREGLSGGKDLRHFLHPAVWQYADEMNFYKEKGLSRTTRTARSQKSTIRNHFLRLEHNSNC